MEFSVPKRWSGTPVKVGVLILLTFIIAILTVYSLSNNVQVVFTHLYYIPIILAAYWFERDGVIYAILVSIFYIISIFTFNPTDMAVITAAAARVVVFIGISLVIALLASVIHRQQEQISQSETRFRSIWESIQAAIILVDPETHTIIAANPEAQRLTGFSDSDLQGHVCHKFICPADENKCPISDLGLKVDRAERVLLARDGRKVPVLKTVTDIQIAGKRLFIESFIDITPLKDAENTLIAYIREATLRIRNPVELVRDNLGEIRDDLKEGTKNPDHVAMALTIQEKNMDDILKNLQELERAIAEKNTEIPDALRQYMKR